MKWPFITYKGFGFSVSALQSSTTRLMATSTHQQSPIKRPREALTLLFGDLPPPPKKRKMLVPPPKKRKTPLVQFRELLGGTPEFIVQCLPPEWDIKTIQQLADMGFPIEESIEGDLAYSAARPKKEEKEEEEYENSDSENEEDEYCADPSLELLEEVLTEITESDSDQERLKGIPSLCSVIFLRMTQIELRELPICLTDLRNLRELHLPNTGLKELPPNFGHAFPFLRRLDLSGNPIKRLPGSFEELGHLDFLNLARTRLLEGGLPFSNLKRTSTLVFSSDKAKTVFFDAAYQGADYLKHVDVNQVDSIYQTITTMRLHAKQDKPRNTMLDPPKSLVNDLCGNLDVDFIYEVLGKSPGILMKIYNTKPAQDNSDDDDDEDTGGVTENETKMVGFLVVKDIDKGNTSGFYLDVICTEPNKGYGRSLITGLLEFAQAKGKKFVQTDALEISKGFFQKMGFTPSHNQSTQESQNNSKNITTNTGQNLYNHIIHAPHDCRGGGSSLHSMTFELKD